MVVVVVVDGKGERDGEVCSESSVASAGSVRNHFILIFAVRPWFRFDCLRRHPRFSIRKNY